MTGECVRFSSTIVETNFLAAWVATTRTSAPNFINSRINKGALYAAMEPVTPTIIFLFFRFIIICPFKDYKYPIYRTPKLMKN
ncbi:hypothetical protein SDC9_149450 [bioreactor metagenome]|uniref:Uncharacterized protein n=1 Tax=bioreactor metagenome TaxID=1076179 RepID=A0A645EL89_9ZZZZ